MPLRKKSRRGDRHGRRGSDIAVDAADLALADDEIKELLHLFALSKRRMTVIKVNLTLSMLLNTAATALSAALPGPVTGALVHNAGSVLDIIHSALLLKWRKKIW